MTDPLRLLLTALGVVMGRYRTAVIAVGAAAAAALLLAGLLGLTVLHDGGHGAYHVNDYPH